MAENKGGGGGDTALTGVIVGALLIAMVGLGFYAMNGADQGPQINVEVPEAQTPG